jgi:DNA-directed RNA polymerase specialized sigma24 family protein
MRLKKVNAMGSVRVDIHRRERQYEQQFPMHTTEGVSVFLENYQYIRSRRLKGDLDASLLLLDFDEIRNEAPLTRREREVIFLRYEQEFTEKETARHLDVSIRAVEKYRHRAILKIADTAAVREGYTNVDKHLD